MRVYECFADDCPFTSGILREYQDHLFNVHTEDDPAVDRHEVVGRTMVQQGYVTRSTGRPVPPFVPSGGMRRMTYDYGRGDVW